MLAGLEIEVSSVGVAELYQDFVDTFVLDQQDVEHNPAPRQRLEKMGLAVIVTDTVMSDMDKSVTLGPEQLLNSLLHQKRFKAVTSKEERYLSKCFRTSGLSYEHHRNNPHPRRSPNSSPATT